jgi:hypothetical protein
MTIDAAVYARYMTAIADRLKAPLADATNALYYVTLSNALTTEAFEAAAQRVFAEYDDFGFPPPAIFFAAVTSEPVFDSQAILRQIDRLATYNPNVGMIPPNVGQVREALGDLVADAYASAGTDRLRSDDETTRSIAQRDFAKALTEYARMPETPRQLIASAPEARRISNRSAKPESLAAIVQRALPTPAETVNG